MRIGVNARLLLSKNLEGIPGYIYETTSKMATNHPDDEFILFYDRFNRDKLPFPSNVKHVVIPLQARHPVLWYFWFEWFMPVYLKIYKVDIFYSADGYLSLSTDIPTVMVIHDLAFARYPDHISVSILKYYRKYVPKFLNKAMSIVTVSNYVKDDISKLFDIPDQKIHVAYNAVSDSDKTQDKGKIRKIIGNILTGLPYFIYVGSLHPRKNIVRLISAFDLYNKNNDLKYKLILAGRMAWKASEIKDEIADTPNVLFTGMISEDEKKVLIQNARALIYVSLFEGFGIPILEAMIHNTPVITSDVSSMPEVAGGAAILVNPEDVINISAGIKLMAEDTETRNKYIALGKSRVLDFSWEDSSKKIYDLLVEALKKK
ncbi:MAG: glycosyltransferase family 4 protein [Saprospiraceae bacterium]|nr:glycosyltransferase family 4 protein [Saprospiraceae bacterium]